MKNRTLAILCLLCLFYTGCGKIPERTGEKQNGNGSSESIEDMAGHYWNNFDFTDTTLINKPDISEQKFVDFIQILPYSGKYAENITSLLDKALTADTLMFAYFADLSEKYLYDPNSPMRNEELYIPVLHYIVSSPSIAEEYKIRARHRLETALKNRPGDIAADFTYTLANGREEKLSDIASEYTVLFFNDPDCRDCKRVKQLLQASGISDNNQISVLSVYTGEDMASWRATEYPASWTNAYDKSRKIARKNIYDLKAIPCLYLLDRDKRVILKDAPVEIIATWIERQYSISR